MGKNLCLRSVKDPVIRTANQAVLRYLNSLPYRERELLCKRLDTTEGYLRKAATVGEKLRPHICVELEHITSQHITRQHLRPYDWRKIWPELTTAASTS